MLDGTLSRSMAPGSAGVATVAAGAAEAAGRAAGRGGGSGVVPITRISGRVAAPESAVGLDSLRGDDAGRHHAGKNSLPRARR